MHSTSETIKKILLQHASENNYNIYNMSNIPQSTFTTSI